jgi:nucleoside-diphosphate kinase
MSREDTLERTFAIIKPDAVERNVTGKVLEMIEAAGFKIVGMKKIRLSKCAVEGFYYVHKERPFFGDLCTFMARGPVIALVLEKKDAILSWRGLMGATNPANAEEGTIRKALGVSIEENTVHGSDSPESASFEIPYFFSQLELV